MQQMRNKGSLTGDANKRSRSVIIGQALGVATSQTQHSHARAPGVSTGVPDDVRTTRDYRGQLDVREYRTPAKRACLIKKTDSASADQASSKAKNCMASALWKTSTTMTTDDGDQLAPGARSASPSTLVTSDERTEYTAAQQALEDVARAYDSLDVVEFLRLAATITPLPELVHCPTSPVSSSMWPSIENGEITVNPSIGSTSLVPFGGVSSNLHPGHDTNTSEAKSRTSASHRCTFVDEPADIELTAIPQVKRLDEVDDDQPAKIQWKHYVRFPPDYVPQTPPLPEVQDDQKVVRHTSWSGWTVDLKVEAFARIRFNLDYHLEIGRDAERTRVAEYLEAKVCTQALYVAGSSPQTSTPLMRALLRSIKEVAASNNPQVSYECVHADAARFNGPHELYGFIRSNLKCRWDLPYWRSVESYVQAGRTVPALNPKLTSVVIIEHVDVLVKTLDSKMPTLDRLLRFLNAHVRERGLKLILLGHEAKTVRRFSTGFGGFSSTYAAKYVFRLPDYTFKAVAAHLQVVAESALTPMGEHARLDDVIAKQAIQWAAQKALKYKQCELEPVISILHRAFIKVYSECRVSDFVTDESKWKVEYKHVTEMANILFQHDLVNRIQCLGVIPQAVLLVLIDAGPCTEQELFQHVYDRHYVHVWILIIAFHRREKFKMALELLLYVPVVKYRDVEEIRGGRCRTRREYYALPTREHLVAAAGSKKLIQMIL